MLDLDNAIELCIKHIYILKNDSDFVSTIMSNNNIEYSNFNFKIITDKLIELGIFEMTNNSTKDQKDFFLEPNCKGYEFYQEFKTYNDYLVKKEKVRKSQERRDWWANIANKSAFWGGLIFAGLSFGFTIFQFYDNKQTNSEVRILKEKIDSLQKIKSDPNIIIKSK